MSRVRKYLAILSLIIVVLLFRSEFNLWRTNKLINSSDWDMYLLSDLEVDSLQFIVNSRTVAQYLSISNELDNYTLPQPNRLEYTPVYECIYTPEVGTKYIEKELPKFSPNLRNATDSLKILESINWANRLAKLGVESIFDDISDESDGYFDYYDIRWVWAFIFSRVLEKSDTVMVQYPMDGEWNTLELYENGMIWRESNSKEQSFMRFSLKDTLNSRKLVSRIVATLGKNYGESWIIKDFEYELKDTLFLPNMITVWEKWEFNSGEPDSIGWTSRITLTDYEIFNSKISP